MLIAVALMGCVLALSDDAAYRGFHRATYAMAGAALAAALVGWFGPRQLDAKTASSVAN